MLKEIKSREFANGKVYMLRTYDDYPIETTDTFLPYYTKNCINEHTNELKSDVIYPGQRLLIPRLQVNNTSNLLM